MEVPIVESGGAQTGFVIFGRSGVLYAEKLRVDAVADLEREEKEGATGWGLRGGGHRGRGA